MSIERHLLQVNVSGLATAVEMLSGLWTRKNSSTQLLERVLKLWIEEGDEPLLSNLALLKTIEQALRENSMDGGGVGEEEQEEQEQEQTEEEEEKEEKEEKEEEEEVEVQPKSKLY